MNETERTTCIFSHSLVRASVAVLATHLGFVGTHSGVLADPIFPNPVFEAGSAPQSLSVGDFNADGRPDLAVVNFDSKDVSVLLGKSDGTFTLQSRFAVGDAPRFVTVVDFNRDGFADLLVSRAFITTCSCGVTEGDCRDVCPVYAPGDITVLVGNGQGSFAAQGKISAGDDPHEIAVGDFNRDGITDLAVANSLYCTGHPGCDRYSGNGVFVLLGRHNGSFAAGVRYAAGNDPETVALGDFNGDGVQDLATANFLSGDVSLLLGRGDGTFAPETRFVANGSPFSVAVGDLNSDGRQDLVVGSWTTSSLSVLLGNGDGTLAPPVLIPTGPAPTSVAIGDFNADGKPDLVAANRNSDDLSIITGHGDGTFDPDIRAVAGGFPGAVAIADFDSDGAPDLAVASADGDSIWVLRGSGDGTFRHAPGPATGTLPRFVAVGDLDIDGRNDLAVANFGSNDVSILLGHDDGTFAHEATLGVGSGPLAVAIGDVNGDGRDDLVTANFTSGDLSILLGRGGGFFEPEKRFGRVPYFGPLNPRAVAIGDFNSDGKKDVVVAGPDVDVFLGNGDATFSLSFQGYYLVGLFLGDSVAIGDFNSDGKQDLVAADSSTDHLWLLLGRGDGSFVRAFEYNLPIDSSPRSVLVGDFNHDGKDDFAVPNGGYGGWSPAVSVFLGNGAGGFAVPTSYPVALGVLAVTTGDLNGDGKDDLATANSGSNDVSVLPGNGDGTFGPQVRFAAGASPRFLAVADFSSDMRPDLAVANFVSNDVSILLNQGPIFPNQPPVAAAGADQRAECVAGGAVVRLDGSASTDPDSTPGTHDDITTYEWFEDFGLSTARRVGTGKIVTVTLPLGAHAITLQVSDRRGARGRDQLLVEVFAVPDQDGDGYTRCLGDCDDTNPAIHPGAVEVCNGLDDNCEGGIDEGGDSLCSDPNACTIDRCAGPAGCLHTPISCDDGNPCTSDACDPSRGCTHLSIMDMDGDGHLNLLCGGNDCNDTDPLVWSPPIEVANVTMTTSATNLTWDNQGSLVGPGTLYEVGSGSMDKEFGLLSDMICLGSGTATSFMDGRGDPPLGQGFWYLIRGRNSCGTGTYGGFWDDIAPACP